MGELAEVTEFYVTDDNVAEANIIYKKSLDGHISFNAPTKYIKAYLGSQGVVLKDDLFSKYLNNNENDNNINTTEQIDSL